MEFDAKPIQARISQLSESFSLILLSDEGRLILTHGVNVFFYRLIKREHAECQDISHGLNL